jgi:uracil-DNA glycosylase family 4
MDFKTEKLKEIKDEILNLKESSLYAYRTENHYFPVIGEGNHDAHIVFIGEAPGENEAKTARPFCGASGRILDELLASIDLDRKSVYVTNIVKDRPPGNRDPLPSEIALYGPFLMRQIEIIQPKVIATLGRFSMQWVLEQFKSESAGGAKYTYSNYYRANVATSIDVRYKLKSGNYSYINLSSAPASTTWKAKSFTITVPANAVALTVMHSIAKVGYLETDAYSLTPQDTSTPTPTPTATPTPTPTPSPSPTATPSPVVNNLIINPSLEIQDTNGKPSNWHSDSWGTNTSSRKGVAYCNRRR